MIQKIRIRVLNDYSSFGYGFFIDKKGRKIWYFENENSAYKLILFHRGNPIGLMQYFFDEDHIVLGNIEIFGAFPQLRNSGIGSWMFSKLIEIAKEHDYKYIAGKMVPEKPELMPDLVKFYRTQGCKIEDRWFKLLL